jgi:hypothetical protein
MLAFNVLSERFRYLQTEEISRAHRAVALALLRFYLLFEKLAASGLGGSGEDTPVMPMVRQGRFGACRSC